MGWARGRNTLREDLRSLAVSTPGPGNDFVDKTAPPLAARPELVSLPEVAGVCDPEKHLVGGKFERCRNLERLVSPSDEWALTLPRPCHVIAPEDEVVLRRKLVSGGLAELIEESEAPQDPTGRKLLAGIFAVNAKSRAIVL